MNGTSMNRKKVKLSQNTNKPSALPHFMGKRRALPFLMSVALATSFSTLIGCAGSSPTTSAIVGSSSILSTSRQIGAVSDLAGIRGPNAINGGVNQVGSITSQVSGMVSDSQGNLYFSDNGAIRKLSANGLQLTTLAGVSTNAGGFIDGQGTNARFGVVNSAAPQTTGLAVDANNNIYYADAANNAIRKIDQTGLVTTVAYFSSWNLFSTTTSTASNVSLAVDPSGSIAYLLDITNTKLWRIDLNTGNISAPELDYSQMPLGYYPSTLGQSFSTTVVAQGLRTDSQGNFLALNNWGPVSAVSSTNPVPIVGVTLDDLTWSQFYQRSNAYGVSFKNTLVANITGTLAAGQSVQPGTGVVTSASVTRITPSGFTVDESNNVFVADSANNIIYKIDRTVPSTPQQPRAWSPNSSAFPGTQGLTDGPSQVAQFNTLSSLSADQKGNIYFFDTITPGATTDYYIRKINKSDQSVRTVLVGLSASTALSSLDGITRTPFQTPSSMIQDNQTGNFYVLDRANLVVSQIDTNGSRPVITSFAGFEGVAATGPTAPLATALAPGQYVGSLTVPLFATPIGLGSDGVGNIYVADAGITPNTNAFVTKINLRTKVARTVSTGLTAGGISAFTVDTNAPGTSGNAYVIDSNGSLLTASTSNFGLTGGTSFSTVSLSQTFGTVPNGGLAVDERVILGVKSLYVADSSVNVIYQVTLSPGSSGTVSIFAGKTGGTSTYRTGLKGQASFAGLRAITFDPNTNTLYAIDNNLICAIDSKGTVRTIAGQPGAAATGSKNDVGSAATFNLPAGLMMGQDGYLYVMDSGNALIRKIQVN